MPENMEVKGLTWNLNEEDDARRARRERAKKGLEPTLPWRVKVVFENVMGEEVMTWDTGLTIKNWDSRVEMRFCPDTDIEVHT